MDDHEVSVDFIPLNNDEPTPDELRSMLESLGVDTSNMPREDFQWPDLKKPHEIHTPEANFEQPRSPEEQERIDQSYRDAYGEEYPGQWDYLDLDRDKDTFI